MPPRREISEAEAAFNSKIVAFQAGNSVADIVGALKVRPTIVYRVLRAAGLTIQPIRLKK